MGDGSLQKQFQSYKLCLQKAEKLSVSRESVAEDLSETLSALNKDLKFIQSGIYAYTDCTLRIALLLDQFL